MRLPKKKAKIVLEAVGSLEGEAVLNSETADRIRAHIEPISFDWRRLARYSFIAAIICIVISVSAALFDEAIMRWFDRLLPILARLFKAPPAVHCGALAALSGVVIWLGLKRRKMFPDRIYSTEAIFTFAVLGIAGSVYCLSLALPSLAHSACLLALAGLTYVILGAWLESKLVWGYGLFTLSSAIGSGTDYMMGGYYLWENTPVLSLAYGLGLVAGAEWLGAARSQPVSRLVQKLQFVNGVTRVVGLLHVFISLWILSIWGSSAHHSNVGDFKWDCLIWAILFGAVAAVAVARALEKDDAVLRGFGLTFFFINLYTAFFQYFWDGLHKAIFFAILGVSFWLLGRKAEMLWKLKVPRRPE
jgi:hypothetical protein